MPAGVVAHRRSLKPSASSSEPDPFGSPTNRWTASTAITPSPLWQTITGTTAVASDGDVVGSWRSSHGNASLLAAQANDTTRPVYKESIINGHPVVRFTRTNSNNLKATFTRNQPHTIFVVGQTTGNTTSYLFDGTATNNTPQCINETSATNYDAYAGGGAVASITIADGTPFIYCAVYNGASSRARLNAGTAASASVGTNNATGLTVASRQDNLNFHTCDIAEIVIYDSALSTGDEQSERDILNTWYAVF
jgi:hypothetical protein